MASPISKTEAPDSWQGRIVSHGDFAARLAVQREVLGKPDMPRNGGKRRTASKRALLDALDRAGATW